jgi:hypothetical protein
LVCIEYQDSNELINTSIDLTLVGFFCADEILCKAPAKILQIKEIFLFIDESVIFSIVFGWNPNRTLLSDGIKDVFLV